jgi:hypothetical protein
MSALIATSLEAGAGVVAAGLVGACVVVCAMKGKWWIAFLPFVFPLGCEHRQGNEASFCRCFVRKTEAAYSYAEVEALEADNDRRLASNAKRFSIACSPHLPVSSG